MIEGFYSVVFHAPAGLGGGTLHLTGGKAFGGDSTMFYAGTYSSDGSAMTGNIRIGTHLSLPGHMSVFGIPAADLVVNGSVDATGGINGEATSPQAPGITMKFTMKKIAL